MENGGKNEKGEKKKRGKRKKKRKKKRRKKEKKEKGKKRDEKRKEELSVYHLAEATKNTTFLDWDSNLGRLVNSAYSRPLGHHDLTLVQVVYPQ